MEKISLTINRNGKVVTEKQSDNQCREVGHQAYKYGVRITTSSKLNKQGFIIDHNYIHTAVEAVIKNKMGSCEELCISIAQHVALTVFANGAEVKHVYVRLQPVLENQKPAAFMEVNVEY